MKRFKNILVGVDLAYGDTLVSTDTVPPTKEAVAQAVWLAKANSARLLFFHVLPSWTVGLATETPSGHQGKYAIVDHATNVIADMVESARTEGLAAEGLVVHGRSWLEIIRQVLRENHDLVIAGTRHVGSMRDYLMGSTGIKLLRKCPCPVWVTKPKPRRQIGSILVAHDLRPVGDLAMELGCSMAQLHGAQLHVLHAAEYPEFKYALPARVSAEKAAEYREQAERHIAAQLAEFELPQPAQVHFIVEPPDFAILSHIERHGIDLLIMGTVGRTGIRGLITGNTAEQLLPRVPCSLLAVKPTGFESPITSDEE